MGSGRVVYDSVGVINCVIGFIGSADSSLLLEEIKYGVNVVTTKIALGVLSLHTGDSKWNSYLHHTY